MSWQLLLFFIFGLAFLTLGADLLVRGAARIAQSFGIPAVIVGLTLVAFGTSAPEAVVTAGSALAGQTGIAVGNVLGSNIFNVLLILGVCAVVTPLAVSRRLVRLDVPIMVAASVLVLYFAMGGGVSRGEGLVLLCSIIGYTLFLILRLPADARRRGAAAPATPAEHEITVLPVHDALPLPGPAPSCTSSGPSSSGRTPSGRTARSIARDAFFVIGGLALLVLGSRWLVTGAAGIARDLGVSDLVIGLTVVAAGTSLPELAASLTAAVRGERDMAVGNIVGSNIFNLLFVLGIGSVLAPDGLHIAPVTLTFDLPIMMTVGAVCLPLFFTGYTLDRWEGALFVTFYVVYMVLLLLRVTSDVIPSLSSTLLLFVMPLTLLTLIVAGMRGWERSE